MARDRQRLERMYGKDPLRPAPGWSLAIWASALLLAAAGSLVLSVVSLIGATTEDAATVQLREWGVLGPGEAWVAVHVDDARADAGCAVTDTDLVRWVDRSTESRLALAGATVVREARGIRVTRGADVIFCPSDPGSDLRAFFAITERKTRVRQGDWHPGPDPRIAHLGE